MRCKRRLASVAIAFIVSGCGSVVQPTSSPTPQPTPSPEATATPVPSAAGRWLADWFKTPFLALPPDVQDAFERRYDAAVGNTLDGLSSVERLTRAQGLSAGGYPRLGDADLIDYLRLYDEAIHATDTTTCASIALAGEYATDRPRGIDAALAALEPRSYERWMDIQVRAIEAEAAKTPEARSLTQAEVGILFAMVAGQLSPEERSVLWPAKPSAPRPTDEVACAAYRHYLDAQLRLPATDLARYGLYSVGAAVAEAPSPTPRAGADIAADIRIAPPYTIAPLVSIAETEAVAGIKKSLGALAPASVGIRSVTRDERVVGLLVVLDAPGTSGSEAASYRDRVMGVMAGGAKPKRSTIDGHRVLVAGDGVRTVGVVQLGGTVLLVFSIEGDLPASILEAVIAAG